MLIVFEGIDGSGKTTLSNRVARELRKLGFSVRHVREDGRLASPLSEGLRHFTRNPMHLELTPTAELLLYAAREAQLLEEVTRPALAEHEIVIADRFFYTAEVLARWGRGLSEEVVRPVLAACARGLEPERVFLLDVDPAIAKARRRAAKVVSRDRSPPSRKGLTGSGLQARLREGYRALAEESPERWTLVENTDVPPDDLVRVLVHEVLHVVNGKPQVGPSARGKPFSRVSTLEEARARFLRRLDGWCVDEPYLVAGFITGMQGPDIDERRRRLAPLCPELIAESLSGLTSEAAWSLRRELETLAPAHVLDSLTDLAAEMPQGWELRERWEAREPESVADSLEGLTSERAWWMRERLYVHTANNVAASLAGIEGERAWTLRQRWLEDLGGDSTLTQDGIARVACRSIRGLDSERAWAWRRRLWSVAPDAVLRSLEGLDSERAWELRERHVTHAAKVVLPGITGMDVPHAWALRASVGTRCEEVLDSLAEMDCDAAWLLRTKLADTWPAATVKSLGGLAARPMGRALAEGLLETHPHDFALLRQAARVAPQPVEEVRDASA